MSKILYELGALYRNPTLNKAFKDLLITDFSSYESLIELQQEKLYKLLEFTSVHTKYYKGLGTSLLKYDIINKDTLRTNNRDIHSDFNFDKRFFSSTSGTTGVTLNFFRNEEWDSANRAAMFRAYSWYNIKPWDRNGYFWGYKSSKKDILKTKILDILQNRFRLFSYSEKEIITFVKQLESAKYISGYSSMIYEVAKIINKLGIQNKFNLSMVKGTSEMIYPYYQEEVLKAFGQKIISEYGSAESGLIAFECPYGNMHINMENVYVEEIEGEIVVTNLLSYSFPIIRYRLGDLIELAPESFKCPCGRSHRVLKNLQGRVGKKMKGWKNEYPSTNLSYSIKNIVYQKHIELAWQATQNEIGKCHIKIEQNCPELKEEIQCSLFSYFKGDIQFTLEFNARLHDMNGKFSQIKVNI